MKSNSKLMVAALVAGMTAGGVGLAQAGDHRGSNGDGGKHGYHHGSHHDMEHGGKHGGKMLGRALRKLDLSDEQKAQLKEVREAAQNESKPLRDTMHDQRRAEREALAAGADEKTLKKLARDSADTRVELMLHGREVRERMMAVLTAEQKQQLQEMKAEHEANRAERMKKWQERKEKRNDAE